MSSDKLSAVLDRIDADFDKSLERLFDLLRIPSISTDPAHAGDCRAAAEWLAKELTGIGIESSVRDTNGHPMVIGHRKGKGKPGPHVLFYGHYDVQPVDPLDLWETEPFAPRIATKPDGTKIIVARGAADDKGQLMTFVEAARAWISEAGDLPISVSVMLEGEEESGSPSLHPFLEANGEELKADLALVCDTGMWDARTPAITTMLRGLVGEEITITAANRDLHSGMYGGLARNPIHVLVDILDGLRDETGRVTVPNFYDGVIEMPADVKEMWDGLGFSSDDFLGDVGLNIPAGETDRTPLEKVWTRPTCEINGISGGYQGAGFKTVIASKASAKVSFRLVGNQDPEKIRAAFRAYVRAKVPADCKVDFAEHGGSPALRLDFDSPSLAKARDALSAEWGTQAVTIGCGGSIPIVGDFKTKLGMDSLLVGFGLDDDQVHSPNEKYNMTSFHHGIRSWARILDELSK
ncbi:acetylornithine deacetylase/succinyl-diaminopimelate desuccinylase-like protein [Breoghania corrubedonensis]|uniref:Acetylornithine deacetylase/succinyl-diaminopimelate desuccinylase-like protein n=1 Tax=Breoghania corrubedonensis TaxID=665038 RepID=A0A2T5UW80_9HYPH|nr:dipeptidase [Breoghania corrubedonensis]PTW55750.1 acetylornithine deacetylase/succinyl-diaminopimelate desuccinylase-like protein [Breoghania corrubedonensis]